MSCLKSSISIECTANLFFHLASKLLGSGTYWRTYVKDGDESYMHHHAVSICNLSAHEERLLGRFVLLASLPYFHRLLL